MHYGYGMTCMYSIDYQAVGGYNTSIVGWGGEDVDLYQRHVKSDLQVNICFHLVTSHLTEKKIVLMMFSTTILHCKAILGWGRP